MPPLKLRNKLILLYNKFESIFAYDKINLNFSVNLGAK